MNHVTATDKAKLSVKDLRPGRPVFLVYGWPLVDWSGCFVAPLCAAF